MECLLGGLTMVLLPGVLFSVAVVVVARKVGHYFDREYGADEDDDLSDGAACSDGPPPGKKDHDRHTPCSGEEPP